MVNSLVAMLPALSSNRMVKVKDPVAVGVPLTRPGVACTSRPGGSAPLTNDPRAPKADLHQLTQTTCRSTPKQHGQLPEARNPPGQA